LDPLTVLACAMSALSTLPPAELIQVAITALGEPPDLPAGCAPLLVQWLNTVRDQWTMCAESDRRTLCAHAMRFLAYPREPEELL
jgi:hypothetical protein